MSGVLAGVRRLAMLAFAVLVLGATPAGAEVRSTGYLPVDDGSVRLHYTLLRPDHPGPHPALMVYSGYGELTGLDNYSRFVRAGYAVIHVSMRGTGCSEGVWSAFQPTDGPDGRDAIEWIAAQAWSDGRVGMVGASYAGIVQLAVAAERPPHLRAIAPGAAVADLYRDVAYPGGILNAGLVGFFGASQAGLSAGTAVAHSGAVPADAPSCLASQDGRPRSAANQPLVELGAHPWDDGEFAARSVVSRLGQVEAPVFMVVNWPDGVTGSRGIHALSRLRGPYHAIFANGGHAEQYNMPPVSSRLLAFLDRYVKDRDNGFESTPPVEVWWEVQRRDWEPGWRSSHSAWPPPETVPVRFHLADGGRLRAEPGSGAGDRYAYLGSGGQSQSPNVATRIGWEYAPPAGAALAYTSAPLSADLAVVGSASLDLWLATTATDTDVQATLTQVLPDGREQFIQRGWLRASHRALDPGRSSPTAPYHTHREEDALPMTPGLAAPLRVEIHPFANVFRAGSRVRVWIEAPAGAPDLWAFQATPVPAVNTVLHGGDHPSALVLPALPGATAGAPYRGCFDGTACRGG